MRAMNVLHLGIKELRGLVRDPMLMVLIVYAFTLAIYTGAKSMPENLNKAPISIVDEDRSPLSQQITDAFYPPYFMPPTLITPTQMDARMDAGTDTFALSIPPDFEANVLAGRSPALQLNVDATRMSQAFTGTGYVQQIVTSEVNSFLARHRDETSLPVGLDLRARFNPGLNPTWFGALSNIITMVTMLGIVLTGAALIREREHGTVEHLLVMPVSSLEIMLAKVWSMGLVVVMAAAASLVIVVEGLLQVPVAGSLSLFLLGTALDLFAVTSLGIMLATLAGSMPQFGLLLVMVLLPLQVLSGTVTPRESMPWFIQDLMLLAPNTHFAMFAEAVLFRGAGLAIVWPQLVALAVLGCGLFMIAHARFRAFLR